MILSETGSCLPGRLLRSQYAVPVSRAGLAGHVLDWEVGLSVDPDRSVQLRPQVSTELKQKDEGLE